MNPRRFAIQLMIAQGILFAIETAAIHHIGSRMSLMQLALIRAGAGAALAIVLARSFDLSVFRTRQLLLQLLRGGVGFLYLWVLIYSFSNMPFADATAISYTQAAYIAVFSALILRERVTPLRWAGAGLGIVGALLIAKPVFAGWNGAYLIALLGTGFNGLGFVLNKYLQQKDSEATTMFYTNLVPFIANLPVLLTAAWPSIDMLPWLPAILVLGPLGMYAGIVAVKYASASMLGPYTFLRLVIGLAAGALVFHELPDALSALGALLILGSCLLSSRSGPPRGDRPKAVAPDERLASAGVR